MQIERPYVLERYQELQAGLAKKFTQHAKLPFCNQFLELYHEIMPPCAQHALKEKWKYLRCAGFGRLEGN